MPQASPVTYLESELDLPGLDSARFRWEGRSYCGRPCLTQELEADLLASESAPDDYGHKLFDAIFPVGSELREGLRGALLAAERDRSRLRLLLHLSPSLPDWIHSLYWELLTDPERRLPLACSPDTAFSRYLDVREALEAPASGRLRLLCVVAAPSNIKESGLAEVHRGEVVRQLTKDLKTISGTVDVEFLKPPITLERLRDRLMADVDVHVLHFFGHGHSRAGTSYLVLEGEQGRAQFVREELLAKLFLGIRELRLITLIACHGGAPSSRDPFSGLAGRLVQGGLPAVIAMRREVSFEMAHTFTRHFYRQLARSGQVDAAVNEARHQLHLDRHFNRHRKDRSEIDWSSPVLYSRLKDGRLWPPRDSAGVEKVEPSNPFLHAFPRRRLRSLTWLPTIFSLILFSFGVWPIVNAGTRLDPWTSALSFRLACSATVIEALRLQEIVASQLAELCVPSRPPARSVAASRSVLQPEAPLVFDTEAPPRQEIRADGGTQRFTFSPRVTINDEQGALPPAQESDAEVQVPEGESGRQGGEEIRNTVAVQSRPQLRYIAGPAFDMEPANTLMTDNDPDTHWPEDDVESDMRVVSDPPRSLPPGVPPYCDAELLRVTKSPMGYQVRGDRCEGIYPQQISTTSVAFRSFVKGFVEFNPETQAALELTWKAPAGIAQNVRLRAFSFKSRVYFRMDTAQPATKESYRWPTEVLAGQRLGHDDLGVLAWIEMPGPGDKTRSVYLPLRAGRPQTLDGYEVTLVPSRKLKKVFLTVIQIDNQGNKVRETGITNKDVGGEFAFYPSNEPTVLSTGKLGAPGYYRLQIKATTASGDSVTKDLDFYHSGD